METIKEGSYSIPEGCTARICAGVITVAKKKSRCLAPGEHRCKDCKHQGEGYSLGTQVYLAKVCMKRPKKEWGSRRLYYDANDNHKTCEMFELKEGRK